MQCYVSQFILAPVINKYFPIDVHSTCLPIAGSRSSLDINDMTHDKN